MADRIEIVFANDGHTFVFRSECHPIPATSLAIRALQWAVSDELPEFGYAEAAIVDACIVRQLGGEDEFEDLGTNRL